MILRKIGLRGSVLLLVFGLCTFLPAADPVRAPLRLLSQLVGDDPATSGPDGGAILGVGKWADGSANAQNSRKARRDAQRRRAAAAKRRKAKGKKKKEKKLKEDDGDKSVEKKKGEDVANVDGREVVLQALDKASARITTFSGKIGGLLKFRTLEIRVRRCQRTPSGKKPEVAAYLQIFDVDGKSKKREMVFSGWMFVSSPALSAMDHPTYDVWVKDCK
jgi:hypothetical protein